MNSRVQYLMGGIKSNGRGSVRFDLEIGKILGEIPENATIYHSEDGCGERNLWVSDSPPLDGYTKPYSSTLRHDTLENILIRSTKP